MTVLEVPGEPRLFRSASVRPERVTLPLRPWSRMHGFTVFAALCGVFCLIGGVGGLPRAWDDAKSLVHGLYLTGFLCLLVAAGVYLTGMAVTAVVDAIRGQPLLIVDREEFIDTRVMRSPIAWADVVSARIVHQDPRSRAGTVFGVLLTVKHAVHARYNPFRYGIVWMFWRPLPNQIYVPLLSLEVRSHTIAHVILELVRQHGGHVEAA